MEQHDDPMDVVVFLVPGSRWSESRERLHFMIDIEQSLHPSQRTQTHFGFRTRQPADQAIVEHVMTAQQQIVEDFKYGTRSIDDCLKVGFESNERVLLDLPDASGSGIPSCSISNVLRSQHDGA